MYQPKSPHTRIALSVIAATVKGTGLSELQNARIPDELSEKYACFVSIHLIDGSLRGCIGTIEPREKNLFSEIISNAISAATNDSRFSPVRAEELESLTVSVDVLGKPELVKNLNELDPVKFGVIVSDGAFSRGVLLPNLEGIDTAEKQLSIAKRKAGLQNFTNEQLKIYSFTSTRYH